MHLVERLDDLVGERGAVLARHGSGADRGRPARRPRTPRGRSAGRCASAPRPLSSIRCSTSLGLTSEREPGPHVDARRLAERHDRARTAPRCSVRGCGPRRSRASRRAGPTEVTVPSTCPATPPACMRTRSPTRKGRALMQDRPGDQVADRLLGRETQDHRGDRPADGERLRPQARRAGGRRSTLRISVEQPDEEADRARGAGIEPAQERGADRAAEVHRERPARGSGARRRTPRGRARRGRTAALPVRVGEHDPAMSGTIRRIWVRARRARCAACSRSCLATRAYMGST